MAGNIVDSPLHIQAAAPGSAMLGTNTRVRGQLGFVGIQTDSLLHADGSTGRWLIPNVRTRVAGAFVVSQSSQGLAVLPSPPGATAPIVVPSGDVRIRCT